MFVFIMWLKVKIHTPVSKKFEESILEHAEMGGQRCVFCSLKNRIYKNIANKQLLVSQSHLSSGL